MHLCLELEGEDAVEFERYMNDPDDITPEGRELLRKARELAKEKSLEEL
jgi:hypothetical protein